MNRELPLYFLGAVLIHGTALWAWGATPSAMIGSAETPAAVTEIEISEEQSPIAAAPSSSANEPPKEEMPPRPVKMPEPEQKREASEMPSEEPAAPVAQSQSAPPRQKPPAPSSRSNPSTSAAATARPVGSANDRSHATWKHRVTPSYPASALMARKAGRVLVTVQVNALGQATAASVSSSSGNTILDSAAARAARESTYHPKCVLGVPLQDTVVIPYNFDIRSR